MVCPVTSGYGESACLVTLSEGGSQGHVRPFIRPNWYLYREIYT